MLFSALSCLALSACCGTPLPSPTAVRADSDDVPNAADLTLTVDMLTHMTTFWQAFQQEPADVRDEKSALHRTTMYVSIPMHGTTKDLSLPVLDLTRIAAQFPSVVADLAHAHLTVPRWTQYRQALFTAVMTDQDGVPTPGAAPSVVWQNVAFLRAHQKELDALVATGMRLPRAWIIGRAAPQLVVEHWLNDSLGSGPHTTFGDGHVYVLNFTAHWCGPCKLVYPVLTALATKYAARGARVMYSTTFYRYYGEAKDIAPAAEVDSLRHYIVAHQLMAPMAVTLNHGDRQFYDTDTHAFALPLVVVIDGAGKVRAFYDRWSPTLPQQLEAKVEELTSASTASAAHKGS